MFVSGKSKKQGNIRRRMLEARNIRVFRLWLARQSGAYAVFIERRGSAAASKKHPVFEPVEMPDAVTPSGIRVARGANHGLPTAAIFSKSLPGFKKQNLYYKNFPYA